MRVAQTLMIFFCVVMYSGGIPMLYLVGAVYIGIAYWLDKVRLLWGSSHPPDYNQDIIERAVNWLLAAAVLHAAVTSWMYGQQTLFPSDWSSLRGFIDTIFEYMLGPSNY